MHQLFLSYVRDDDRDDQGGISKFRDLLSAELSIQAGETRTIFMDRSSIGWGEDWRNRIDEALVETTFFIPVVTPRYFKSSACREELLAFAASAKRLGLEELILPIYYITVAGFGVDADDEAIQLVARYQYDDWRTLRTQAPESAPYRTRLSALAERILTAESIADSKAVPLELVGAPSPAPPSDGAPGASAERGSADETSILDTLAAGEDAIARLGPDAVQVAELVAAIGAEFEAATEGIASSDAGGKGFAGRLVIGKRLAERLEEPTSRLEAIAGSFVGNVLKVDPMLRLVFRILGEDAAQRDQAAGFLTAIVELAQQSDSGLASTESLAEVAAQGKSWSKDLRRPLGRMETALHQIADTRRFFTYWGDEAGRLLNED